MAKRLLPRWQEFEKLSLTGAPRMQREEMKKAFYMGAATLLAILEAIPDEASEEEGAAIFEEAYQECKAYLEQATADYDRRRNRGFGKGGDRND
jgi:ketopantoate reductase